MLPWCFPYIVKFFPLSKQNTNKTIIKFRIFLRIKKFNYILPLSTTTMTLLCDVSLLSANSNFGMKFLSPACALDLGVVDHLLAHCRICSAVSLSPHFPAHGRFWMACSGLQCSIFLIVSRAYGLRKEKRAGTWQNLLKILNMLSEIQIAAVTILN